MTHTKQSPENPGRFINGNWTGQSDTDFATHIPIATKDTKLGRGRSSAIFQLFSLGVVTNRDDWVYGDNAHIVEAKVRHLVDKYNEEVDRTALMSRKRVHSEERGTAIKWTRAVKRDLLKNVRYKFDESSIVTSYYRPFVKRFLYFDRKLNEMVYQVPHLFGRLGANRAFCFAAEERSEFGVIAFDDIPNKDIFMPSAAQVLALWRFEGGARIENITDWALEQFRKHYGGPSPQPSPRKAGRGGKGGGEGGRGQEITKEAIFHYVYGVLHDPIYREKYAVNLKREFPRIPFYPDFWQWSDWGKRLMDLHIGYETVEPFKLKRIDIPDERARKAGVAPKAMLKADKDTGRIVLDSETTLTGVPAAAWDYRLGNRCALEWILDQHKEKTPKDPTIREKFNTYRFADYKEKVVDLLMRVTTVSVETQAIVEAMRAEPRASA